MIKSLPDSVTWEGTDLSYQYYCSRRRRTLAISVFPDRMVLVRAPHGTSRKTIQQFVLSRAGWVNAALRRFERIDVPEPPRYRSGEIHHYAGRKYRLEVKQGHKDSVACLSDSILVTTLHPPTGERVRKLLDRWYRARADILFHDRLAACGLVAEREGIPLPALRIRKMRSRWGSFSTRTGVTLNLMLVMMPVECLDYVILHELCHYKVGHHGAAFWKLLTRLLPDCRERKKALNAYALYLRLT
jgi:predicted metal-dependent hydrolase